MNKISQLLTAPEGYECTGVEGEVTNVFKRSTFSKKGGEGSVQKIVIRGTEGSTIRLAFWGREEFPFAEGAKILVSPSSQGKGLAIKDNEYQGKVSKEISVGDKCSVVPIDEFSDMMLEQGEVVQSNTPISTATNTSNSSGSMLPAPLVQNINLMDLCIQGATILQAKYPDMTKEQFQAITSCFFIEGNKQNLGKSMPTQVL